MIRIFVSEAMTFENNRLLVHIERRNKRRQHFPRDTILIGDDLGVADIGKVPRDRLQGLVSGRGSVNSHLRFWRGHGHSYGDGCQRPADGDD